MKAILEFNLPEDQEEYNSTIKAAEYRSALYEISQWLRSIRKYEDRQTISLEEAEGKFWAIVSSHEIQDL